MTELKEVKHFGRDIISIEFLLGKEKIDIYWWSYLSLDLTGENRFAISMHLSSTDGLDIVDFFVPKSVFSIDSTPLNEMFSKLLKRSDWILDGKDISAHRDGFTELSLSFKKVEKK